MRGSATTRVALLAATLVVATAQAQLYSEPKDPGPGNAQPKLLEKVGIDQKLDAQLPLDATFRDENGNTVQLRQYFRQNRPVILTLVYYNCPMLCSEVITGTTAVMKTLSFNAGHDYQVLSISINPHDTAKEAMRKKKNYLQWYRRPGTEEGWHFLTGEQPAIDAVTKAVGFRYAIDPKSDPADPQYAHANAIIVLTPDGKVAQYYYGIEYSARDVRLGLVEASKSKIGTLADQVLLYCYHYDPTTGRYGAAVMNLVRAGGVLTVLSLAAFVLLMFRRERRGRP